MGYTLGTSSKLLKESELLTGLLDVLHTNASIQNAFSLICLLVPCIQIIERGIQMVGALNRTREKTRGDWGKSEGSLQSPIVFFPRQFLAIFRLRSTI